MKLLGHESMTTSQRDVDGAGTVRWGSSAYDSITRVRLRYASAASVRRHDDERFDQNVPCDDEGFAPVPKIERHRLLDEIYAVALD
jgi:hypothetical protein